MTDAEVVAWLRKQADGHAAEAAYWRRNAPGIEAYANRARLADKDAEPYRRAAAAIESNATLAAENARLRARLSSLTRYRADAWGAPAEPCAAMEPDQKGEWVMFADVDTALRDGGGDK